MRPGPGWLAGLMLAACATAPRPQSSGAGPATGWWDWAADAASRQYLFRMDAEGPEGSGDLKITLRVATGERFQIVGSGPTGRRLWRLDVLGETGVWTGASPSAPCRLTPGRPVRIGPARLDLPLAGLPALLLGRLPVAPGGPQPAAAPGARWLGADGRWWRFETRDGTLTRWTVWSADGSPAAWWLASGGKRELTLRQPAVRLRWQEITTAPLHDPLPAWDANGESLPAECADDLP